MIRLPLFVALRYLFARKSHNVINIISAISAIGLAVGTAALILILSIYNGLDSIVRSGEGKIEPDLLIEPSLGKTFAFSDSLTGALASLQGVASVEPVLDETVFADYEGKQSIARLKGVMPGYFEGLDLQESLVEGTLELRRGSLDLVVTGRGLAHTLGLSPRFVAGVDLYFPRTDKDISLIDPLSSLNSRRFFPSGTVSLSSSFDSRYMIAPYQAVADLLGLSYGECSCIELRFDPAVAGQWGCRDYRKTLSAVKDGAAKILGDGYEIKSREEQNETLYRMLRIEKTMIFLILFFVIIVIAFNVFGSLSMLIMEKSDDISTFAAMGAHPRTLKRIFVYEGWLISVLGLAAGLAAGICLALLQQHFGLLKMPGNYIVTAYPCVLKLQDVLVSVAGVAAVGYLVALLPVRSYFKSRRGKASFGPHAGSYR